MNLSQQKYSNVRSKRNFETSYVPLIRNTIITRLRKTLLRLKKQKNTELDSAFSMKKSRQKKKKFDKGHRTEAAGRGKIPKTKSIIDFDPTLAYSVKCLAVKKNASGKPTTRFFSGKMLMFAKISLESFANDFIKTFFFPNKKTREIYNKYMIERVFFYRFNRDRQHLCIFHFYLQTGKRLAQFQVQRRSF